MTQLLRRMLDTDGRRHPLQDPLSVTTLCVGMVALVLGVIPATHLLGAVAGLIGMPLALYSQMVSDTTGERFFNVIGLVAAFVGFAFALSNGGFVP
ncbi:hypothetical protein DPM19_13445 [Actinomadura craniellae]|uniref:FUSC family protein n=1 Tax=Actinomadura craniellae TaxID=2231787 RepID=A0A365H906_9ACTN|nr:hypothetical protein [Actinomadura craniellae]RAY14743.1 hypothetical protein DPM19_13445 [Actinomadura craniellae]